MTKKILFSAILFLIMIIVPFASAEANDATASSNGCRNLYWFDNDNRLCQSKEFCGEFMYEGLRAFATKDICLRNLMANSINNHDDVLAKEKNTVGMAAAAPVACTMDYNPVCCNIRGDHTTESNNCNCVEAKQGVKLYDGECKRNDTNPNPTNINPPPGLSTRVVVNGKNVDITKDDKGKFKISSEGKQAESDLEISEQNSTLVAKTSTGDQEIKVFPDQAAAKGIKVEEIDSMKLVEENGKIAYDISGTKKGRLFALIPVSGDVEQKVDAKSGEVIGTKTPWWSFLATGI